MILTKLVEYYEREAEAGRAPRYGWSNAKVSWALELAEDGTPLRLLPLNETVQRGKKNVEVPKVMEVPQPVKRASGVCAQFLCDNAEYILGCADKGKPERTKQCHEASKEKHLHILEGLDSPAARAITAFFKSWNPAGADAAEGIAAELPQVQSGGNIVFRIGECFAEDDPAIRKAWMSALGNESDAPDGLCMLTGQHAPIARLHPAIKGVVGAQPSGGSLISYNKGKSAFESFGNEDAQSFNAPVSEYAAFAYTTALNLLISDHAHTVRLGDTTIVYWAEQENTACQDLFASCVFGKESEHPMTDQTLHAFFEHVREGRSVSYEGLDIPFDNPFYILGIAPNAARLSVRFFLAGTFGGFLQSTLAHQERMEIVRPKFQEQASIPIWQMLGETVKPQSRDKSASPLLAGSALRAILMNDPYPAALYENILLRIRAEHDEHKINFRRAAILKACLIKNKGRKITVALDESSTNPAYVLGRLFAVLERIQQDANPGILATIKDRYFNAACATPARVFPVLQKLSQHHLRKLPEKSRAYHEIQVGRIMDLLRMQEAPFPRTLSLEAQGIFILGYYHQRQQFFARKKKTTNEMEEN